MLKNLTLFSLITLYASIARAVDAPINIQLAPGTISAYSAAVIWDKPARYENIVQYHVLLNGTEIGTTTRCNYQLKNLNALSPYTITLMSEDKAGVLSAASSPTKFSTRLESKFINVTTFGAKGDGKTINTTAIQNAIKACPVNGTVYLPKGTFVTGALFLKSNMTLEIANGGVLKGSTDAEDYLPFINNRFEGWEMKTYASLLNAGTMNNKGGYSVENLSIKGQGTISGAGAALGKLMIDKNGLRSRGRLILLMNCKNVEVEGLKIENSPCWTIHYIYSKGVSLHNLSIVSTARNGDGIDPDSSDDSFIFNCNFSTGDDCIAVKSGKNPEGFYIGKPTRNVRITDCNFTKGHGISIGSEMSGGVSDVLVRDCQAGPLLHGMQIKGTKDRGGYVKNVRVLDCQLQQITVFSAVNYNNDGQAAPQVPTFENYEFKNIDLSGARVNEPVININGFDDPDYKLRKVYFEGIKLPKDAEVSITDASSVSFSNVITATGKKPKYTIKNSTEVSGTD